MTKYHRTMLLEKAIDHWNREKYREQGDLFNLHRLTCQLTVTQAA